MLIAHMIVASVEAAMRHVIRLPTVLIAIAIIIPVAGSGDELNAPPESVDSLFYLATEPPVSVGGPSHLAQSEFREGIFECTARCAQRKMACDLDCPTPRFESLSTPDEESREKCMRRCRERSEGCEDRCYGMVLD